MGEKGNGKECPTFLGSTRFLGKGDGGSGAHWHYIPLQGSRSLTTGAPVAVPMPWLNTPPDN